MRGVLTVILALALAATLSGCSLLGLGRDRKIPDGDAWRTDVITVIEETPGVTSSSVVVNDVDGGLGRKGPVLYGAIKIDEGDVQAIVDDAMLRVSDVLGSESNGVAINVWITVAGERPQKLHQFGYDGAGHGAALWDATH